MDTGGADAAPSDGAASDTAADKSDGFVAKSVWQGVSYTPYPFVLKIDKRTGYKFTGTIEWSTLDAKTKVRGSIKDGKIELEEHQVVRGGDSVSVPNKYN